MVKHKIHHCIFLVTALFVTIVTVWSYPAISSSPNEMTLEEQFLISDLVVVAKAGNRKYLSVFTEDNIPVEIEITDTKVELLLKGVAEEHIIRIVTKGDISDLDPECCDYGDRYIFFLRRGRNGLYDVSNGRYSALKLRELR